MAIKITTVNSEGWSWDEYAGWYTSEGNTDSRNICIFTDNQAAIRAVRGPKNQSGQYALGWINNKLLLRSNRKVTIHWIPTYKGVPGNNKIADQLAKEATGWTEGKQSRRPPAPTLSGLKHLVSARIQIARGGWRGRARTKREGTIGRASRKFQPVPDPEVRDKFILDKVQSALIIQARAMHISLRHLLSKRKVPGFPDLHCPCRGGRQNVYHVLLHCPDVRELRE